MLYWFGFADLEAFNYDYGLLTLETEFKRLHELHPDATLFGDNPTWHDVVQGGVGNCYILAAMGALVEYPELIRPVFITDQLNKVGIYTLRFFIRGKPWLVTIDDSILVYTATQEHYFAPPGPSGSLWAAIIEKGWAKVKGSYDNSEGGFFPNGIRALTGVPVFFYLITEDLDAL